jgi:ABC-type antimicrobial peptide transport system permease subunit
MFAISLADLCASGQYELVYSISSVVAVVVIPQTGGLSTSLHLIASMNLSRGVYFSVISIPPVL